MHWSVADYSMMLSEKLGQALVKLRLREKLWSCATPITMKFDLRVWIFAIAVETRIVVLRNHSKVLVGRL